MDKNIIERYKSEMLSMYRNAKTVAAVTNREVQSIPDNNIENSPKGGLVGIVTSFRGLYPVKNALVTVFTGNYNDRQVIDSDYTDQSGRTKVFMLDIPNRELSLDKDNRQIPYASYNMEVKAEGYVDNVHINISVFSGVTSIQRSNMMLLETAGEDKSPQIFDESEKYDL